MTPKEAFALSEALSLLRWQKNKPDPATLRDEDEDQEPQEEPSQPLTMDQQAREFGVNGHRRWL
jgi:hypothetical protein